MNNPRFICFYSYKGGTGRSLALANCAYLLAREGAKVLIMDMDMEAPGQHMTELFHDDPLAGQQGLLDLLLTHKAHVDRVNAEKSLDLFEFDLKDYLRRSSVFDRDISEAAAKDEGSVSLSASGAGSIELLPVVGVVDREFQRKLEGLDWNLFYKKYGGADFFEQLQEKIRAENFNYVLIDSRAGMSDVFFIATLSLADTVVLVSSFNRQNIEGSMLAASTLLSADNIKNYGQKRLLVLFSPCPVHGSAATVDQRINEIKQVWRELHTIDGILPYEPEMALHETLLTRRDSKRVSGIQTEYSRTLQNFLVRLQKDNQNEASSVTAVSELGEIASINPFPAIRVEYWKEKDVISYFVDPGGNIHYAMRQFMPTLLFGSRGTGKTIMARWLSYETLAYRLEQEGKQPVPNNVQEPIGLWFRLDVDLLNVFNAQEETLRPTHNRLFGQFFDLLILRKALEALERLGGIDAWCHSSSLFHTLGREMGLAQVVNTWEDFGACIEQSLADIRAYINNPNRVVVPYLVQDNVFMKLLVEQLLHDGRFRPEHYFIVLVDEYENFHRYQQRIVNTRLKQVKESDRVTYKLLARNDGLRTHDTLAKDQPIEVTHDYRSYNLDEGVRFEDFKTHLSRIIDKRLQTSRYFRDRSYCEAETLLAEQSLEEEAVILVGKRGDKLLRDWLEKCHAGQDLPALLAWMDREDSLLRRAVAVVLLNQGKPLLRIVTEFSQDSSTAKDWYHNYHRGALHWLCSLYKKDKTYAGFNEVVGVAGNNTRVAMDLCYAIVEQWLARDNDRTLPIAVNVQDAAIHTQSEVYFRKLRDRREDSDDFYRFVQRLGRLFQIIHKGPRQGEPEINHFSIDGEVDADTECMLRRCRNDAILRWLPGNKQKSKADEHKDAWQLHPRYAPFFDISWRRKKMLKLRAEELRVLFFGTETDWKKVVKRVEQQYCALDTNVLHPADVSASSAAAQA